MTLGTARIIRADARSLPLADNSVDLVVTSPPYFALRSYQDGGEHYAGQIGDEPTPAEFIESLLEVTRECMRVLKPSGSLWVNLGDKYANSPPSLTSERVTGLSGGKSFRSSRDRQVRDFGIRQKSLIGIPWRYALRCIDDLGLILRAEVIWSKPNGLPESVTDRVRRSHEQWFHFTLSPRYFSAVDEIREPYEGTPQRRFSPRIKDRRNEGRPISGWEVRWDEPKAGDNPLGKLPGSVWTGGDGFSTIGVVLQAVAGGHLTPEEGERVLWAGRTNSGPRSTLGDGHQLPAGSGSAKSTGMATGDIGTPSKATDGHTDSSTKYASGQYPTGTPSTTCATTPTPNASREWSAHTGDASTPTTSKLSPCPSTLTDATSASSSAGADTSTTSETRTSDETASESAEPAWLTGSANGAGWDSPPSVWHIATEPLRVPDHLGVDHFAAFPSEFPKRIIQGWSPAGVCVECGEGRRPVVRSLRAPNIAKGIARQEASNATSGGFLRSSLSDERGVPSAVITGYACACPEPTAPTTAGVVLDCFGGTGTTAMVAKALGRDGISVDMSSDYCRLATWRVNDRDQLAKVLGIEKADPVHEDEQSLLDLLEGGAA